MKENKLMEEELLEWLSGCIEDGLNLDEYAIEGDRQAYNQLKEIVKEHFKLSKAILGGAKPGEYMHEWVEQDAVLFDLPAEEIIGALARDNRILHNKLLQQKPRVEVTDK